LSDDSIDIRFEKRTLPNGLRVVVHEDRSDPLVAVQVAYHVGSAREEPGRTGFAHLFEHMLFQGSAHVPEGGHFKAIHSAGGSLNGTTSLDRTVYYETLPQNHLELALWLESDRMGFLLPAMTQAKLDNQRDVVMNERRQNYDNRPYGRVAETLAALLFPASHPYHSLPIGSMEDIGAATLEDVAAFFRRWYGPNNATLCVAGDVRPERAFELVEKWFGALPPGPAVEALAPVDSGFASERRAVLADRVALPQLSLCWSGAPQFSADAAALELLAMVLSQNKSAVLDRDLMVETTLARAVGASHWAAELAGRFDITVRASPGVTTAELEQRVRGLLASLFAKGVDDRQLSRMKTRCEADVVRSLETVAGRAASLAEFDLFTGDPGYQRRELERLRAVTAEHVRDVLGRYLLAKPAVVLCCVPEEDGAVSAAARPIAAAASPSSPPFALVQATPAQADSAATHGEPDRTRAPDPEPIPEPTLPEVRLCATAQGARAALVRFSRSPWASASLSLPMGRRAESKSETGLASLTAALLSEGTRRHSTLEFTDRLEALGASFAVGAGDDEVILSLAVLERSLDAALELLFEAALEPRFAPEDLERTLTQRRTAIAARGEHPQAVAARAFARLLHGDSPLGRSPVGGDVDLGAMTLERLREFHRRGAHARGARLSIATPRDLARAESSALALVARLPAPGNDALHLDEGPTGAGATGTAPARRLFVIDRPGARQTELRVGQLSVASTHRDYFGLGALNYLLGGSFSSRINLNLRESKGYTYGARSHFAGGLLPGAFTVSAAVETSVTAAAAGEILKELRAIREGVRQDEWEFARTALRQSLSMQLESSDARRAFADYAQKFGWPADYPLRRARELASMTLGDLDRLAREHLDPAAWVVLAVGDAAAVEPSLADLGLGQPTRLDLDGCRVP
jgi:zinc protease